MKKLFTLFALLAMVLSASAKEVIDSEIDFTKVSEYKDYLWNNAEAKARITIQDGCLHFESTEKTGNNWDCQFSPLPGVQGMEEELVYKVTIKIKGSPNARIAAHLAGTDNYGAIEITEDWSVQEIEYPCKDPKGPYSSNHLLNIQCGDFVGYYDIEYIKITHEEEESGNITEWKENLVNGNAEGEYGEIACVQSQEFGMHLDENGNRQIHDADIETIDGNKVFVSHAKAVDPPLLWEEDGEQWGQPHSAGDPKPDNVWQNQMFIVFPRAMKNGEVYTLSFRYKASKAAKVSTQGHALPGQYISGGGLGELSFTTEWQTVEKKITAQSNNDGTLDEQSIAFNLGQEYYDQDVDFYLDDISMKTMVLEEGYFVAAINTGNELAKYDYQNAIKFNAEKDEDGYDILKAVVGTVGDETSWVNEIMISTVRGDDKMFQVNAIKPDKVVNDPDAWFAYKPLSKYKIGLPANGVWQIIISEEEGQINFIKLDGEADREPQVIVANPTEVIVNATEKGEGNPWDNQFFILGNRTLKVGEVVVVEFEYKAEKDAPIGSQSTKGLGEYLGGAWPALEATTEYQTFTQTFEVKQAGQSSFTFNLSEFADANTYYFKNIVFCNADRDESLIDMVGTTSLYVKEGANTAAYEFGTENPNAINNVTVKATSNATYNLAGQRVSKEYKGIAIKNGQKFIVK